MMWYKGYLINQSYEVKVRKLDKASDVLDGLVSAGANQVSNLGLKIDEPEKLQNEARQKAIKDAKEKSDQITDDLRLTTNNIIESSYFQSRWLLVVRWRLFVVGR